MKNDTVRQLKIGGRRVSRGLDKIRSGKLLGRHGEDCLMSNCRTGRTFARHPGHLPVFVQ